MVPVRRHRESFSDRVIGVNTAQQRVTRLCPEPVTRPWPQLALPRRPTWPAPVIHAMATTAATRASPVTPPNPGDGRSPTAGLPGTGAAHRVRAGSLCLSPATPNRPAAVGRLSATPALSTAAAAVAAGFVPAGAAPGERPTKTKRRSRPRPRASADSHKWNTGKWSKDEDAALREGVAVVGARQWKRISVEFLHNQRSDVQCLHRWQKVRAL